MDTISTWLIILFLKEYNASWAILCPSVGSWETRSWLFCKENPLWYHCLNNLEGEIIEICLKSTYIAKGYYPVLSKEHSSILSTECPRTRYQPFGQMSNKFRGRNCLYRRSKCDEVGEETCEEGSSFEDRSCRCRHTDGYVSIKSLQTLTNRSCYRPKYETNGCSYFTCPEDEELNPWYACVKKCPFGYHRRKYESSCVANTSSEFSTSETEVYGSKGRVLHTSSATQKIHVGCGRIFGPFYYTVCETNCIEMLKAHLQRKSVTKTILNHVCYCSTCVDLIFCKLKQRCPEFEVADIIPTGSFYEGTKIGAPDEFDFMLTLTKLSVADKISLHPGCSEWYPHIKLQPEVDFPPNYKVNVRLDGKQSEDKDFLGNPRFVVLDFWKEIKKEMASLSNSSVKFILPRTKGSMSFEPCESKKLEFFYMQKSTLPENTSIQSEVKIFPVESLKIGVDLMLAMDHPSLESVVELPGFPKRFKDLLFTHVSRGRYSSYKINK